jgi:hypothetical protein
MPQAVQIPLQGFMNMDDPQATLPKGHHTFAENISFYNGVAENLLGTTEIVNSYLPSSGTNVIIGGIYDEVKKRIIYFNSNSNNNHGIYIFNTINNTFQRVVQSFVNSSVDFLNFTFNSSNNQNNSIHSVNIIYGEPYNSTLDTGGDLLTFVDTLGRPTKLNIDRYLAGKYTNITRDFIDVAKAPPIMPIKCTYENDNAASGSNFTVTSVLAAVGTGEAVVTFSGTVPVGATINVQVVDGYSGSNDGTIPAQNIIRNWIYTTTGSETLTSLASACATYFNTIQGNDEYGSVVYLYNATSSLGVATIPNNSAATNNSVISTNSYVNNSSANVSVNNLLNSLFQFAYTFIYDDNEESVLSSASITPLPDITFTSNSNTAPNLSSRIALYMETGDVDVKSIRIYGRQTNSGTVGAWFIIDTLQKSYFSISSNSIYRFTFRNDGLYLTADPKFTVLLQDYVPQQTNTQELLDGNTLSYSGITEGYNYIDSNYAITTTNTTLPLYTINGLLFFGYQPKGSNQVTLYLTGVGTNNATTNLPTVLTYPPTTLYVNAVVGNTNVGFNINTSGATTISTILSSLGSAATSAGWTVVTTAANSITLSYTGVLFKNAYPYGLTTNLSSYLPQQLAHYPSSAYSYGVVYYDSKGRTNGVITDVTANITTLPYNTTSSYETLVQVIINNTPPSWATYYHLVRTNTLTYNKYLCWVTNGAICNVGEYVSPEYANYAYLEIDNIYTYNQNLDSTNNVVNYGFSQGDRVRIVGLYNSTGSFTGYTYDYPIVNVVVNPNINGITKTGTFIQIPYPTADITSSFDFPNSSTFIANGYKVADFSNYQIIIYNLAQHEPTTSETNSNVYYEIGQQYGIANAGTSTAYHIGNVGNNIIALTDGDIFTRQRTIPIGATYYPPCNGYGFSNAYATIQIWNNDTSNDITTTNYVIGAQNNQSASLASGSYPNYADNNLFYNKSSNPISIRLRGQTTVYSDAANNITSVGVFLKINTSSNVATTLQIVNNQPITLPNTQYTFNIDATVTIPAGCKASLIFSNYNTVSNLHIGSFVLELDILTNVTINVFDSSFSDSYSLITNNDSRAIVQDRTSLQQYFSTLFRYSEPYQVGTNINNINRFYPANLDEFDKRFGSVVRLKQHGRQLRVHQERKSGVVGVYGQFIKDQTGTNQLVTTDQIITQNNIQYYDFDGGLGNQPSGLVSNGFVDYIPDPVKGVIWRLSQDGGISITTEFKVQTWSGNNLSNYLTNNNYAYGGYSKIIGCWNVKKDKEPEYICTLQSGSGLTGYTIAFNEKRNAFTSFYDFNPDFIICAENELVSFNNGNLYIHNNSSAYNNFYGTQYQSALTIVCNQGNNYRKEFGSLGYNSNQIWTAPNMGDVQTALGQQSNLVIQDMEDTGDGVYVAAFWADNTGNNGVVDGNYLKGVWASVKLSLISSNFAYIQGIYISILDSPKNY